MGGPHFLALPGERKEKATKYIAVKAPESRSCDARGIRHGRNCENVEKGKNRGVGLEITL